jgi:menaquinone-dependent protoporphyrinogen oxidase
VAEAVAEALRDEGTQVDVCRARQAREVGSYQAVIVGASVHMAQLPGEIKRFVKRNRDALSKVPVAHFCVCLAASDPTDENCEAMAGYMETLRQLAPEVEPVDTATFAGAVLADTPEYKRLFPLFKIPVKAMAEQPDHRDWEAIHAWAEGLRPKLLES